MMETKLSSIAQIAKEKPDERITSLANCINERSLWESHKKMNGSKATGEDRVTKEAYDRNLKENITSLVERLKRQAYKPQPVLRVYIPKAGTEKLRPLGIPSYEDKLVQDVLSDILTAVFDGNFLDCSYGFRPNRGQHDALKALDRVIAFKKINYVLDADIKGFFDSMSHEWIMKFIEHRIADVNISRLIHRFLKSDLSKTASIGKHKSERHKGG